MRADLEDRSLSLATAFVAEAELVEARLQAVQELVSGILGDCERVAADLDASERATRLFVTESAALRQQKKQVEERVEAVGLFLRRFQLTDEHVASLEGDADNGEFFDALEQVRRIRDECGELLKGSHQGAGLEILETMVAHQERAHGKIYAWMLRDSAVLARDLDNESRRALISRAFAELKQGSPAFYAHCVELLAANRRELLARKFAQLVGPTPPRGAGTPHIEQHDALRFVSDVLAAAHQFAAEEKDVLGSVTLAEGDGLLALLEQALGGVAQPLSPRLLQTVKAIGDAVQVFRAEQVLDFYADTLAAYARPDADSLAKAVRAVKDAARAQFFRVVEKRGSDVQSSARTRALPGADLSASMDVLELVRTMRDVLAIVKDHSPAAIAHSRERQAQIESALRAFVEPVRALSRTADDVFASSWDAKVFAVNNLSAVQAVLAMHDFTSVLVNELAHELGERLDALAEMRADATLSRSGMSALLAVAERGGAASLEPPRVRAAFEVFYRDLSSSLVMPELDRIDAPRLRHQVRSQACSIVLRAHNALHDAVTQASFPPGTLQYSKEQVADLLQC